MDNFAEHCNRTLPPGGDCHLLNPPIPIDSSCDIENRYTKHFYAGSLEVCVMALRQWEHTQDATYAARSSLASGVHSILPRAPAMILRAGTTPRYCSP